MYEYIKGTLVQIDTAKAIVETNGIAYRILIPVSACGRQIGEKVHFFLSLIVREDSHTLFGFPTISERDLFEKVLSVSGIGPKTALALIGHLDLGNFEAAVNSGDIRLISKVPGIGKKTAERLIIEMRGKISGLNKGIAPIPGASQEMLDATLALIHLGYNPLQAQKAIQKVVSENSDEKNTGNLITLALRTL